MKKIYFIVFCCISLFIGINDILASDIYCESGYTLYTDSSGNKKCKKKIGVPMTEFNTKSCASGILIDDACYLIKDPLKDGCESNYEVYTDSEGNKMCKKKLDDSGITELIETFCKQNSSCIYLKSLNKDSIKCESGYDLYTDSSGNKKCKKKIGVPMTEFGIKSCTSGTLMNGACYSIKNPLAGNDGCGSDYTLYTDSTGKQKCKKKLSDSEITELMIQVCATNTSECQYIKQQIYFDSNDEDLNKGDLQRGCEVIPPEIRRWINNILKFVRYVALALVIALGALDFMKAAGSGEPDAMKKAGQSFVKRLIAVVILFLLPVIVDFILNMINIYGVDPENIDCLKNGTTQ